MWFTVKLCLYGYTGCKLMSFKKFSFRGWLGQQPRNTTFPNIKLLAWTVNDELWSCPLSNQIQNFGLNEGMFSGYYLFNSIFFSQIDFFLFGYTKEKLFFIEDIVIHMVWVAVLISFSTFMSLQIWFWFSRTRKFHFTVTQIYIYCLPTSIYLKKA